MARSALAITFVELMTSLNGKTLWGIVAGAGSIVQLKFGEKRRSIEPFDMGNLRLRTIDRWFEAEYNLMIDCAWRIVRDKRLVTAWRESNEFGGPMLSGLEQLRFHRVVGVTIGEYLPDIHLLFDNGLQLDVFVDIGDPRESECNYSLTWRGQIFLCDAGGTLSLSPYSTSEEPSV